MVTFTSILESTIVRKWDSAALQDYTQEKAYTYGELASEMKALANLWKNAGINPGDKIAINAKSSANWVKAFLACATEGYVSSVLFNGFTPGDTQNLVNHSESRLLYTEKRIFQGMDFEAMPQIKGAIDINTGELLAARDGFDKLYEAFEVKQISKDEAVYPEREMDDLCSIMYTSGSTGNPKGVMLSIRNFSANIDFIKDNCPYREDECYLSILPYAHIFGLTFDAIMPLCGGLHLYILGLPPVPTYLKEAFKKVRPHLFFGVPLVFMKFIDATLGEFINSESGKKKLEDYENHPDFCKMLRGLLLDSMGGNIEFIATGGAAIPSELESVLAFKLQAPFCTGYGMTECAPLLSIGHIGKYKAKSCGEYLSNIEMKINSEDQENIPGEVLVKGGVVFQGYYKNQAATDAVFTEDGWFRTGDMGTIDSDKNLFLVGRCKNMLLSENGQNIYPEEVEVVLNEMPFVQESLLVQRGSRLVALIVVNEEKLSEMNMNRDALENIMQQNIINLNKKIPAYSAVNDHELLFEPFAKTPKGSIRRFLYK